MLKPVVLFPGNGSQYIGMGKFFYDSYKVAKETFVEADDILQRKLSEVCFKGPFTELNKLENSWLGIYVTSVAIFKVMVEQTGIQPLIGAGHSLGEYSALTCSGALDFMSGLKLLAYRASIFSSLKEDERGAFSVITGLAAKTVKDECERIPKVKAGVSIVCYNGNQQVSIGGRQEAVSKVEAILRSLGGIVTPLIDYPAIHSPVMKSLEEKFFNHCKTTVFNRTKFPVVSNFEALPYDNTQESFLSTLSKQISNPVRWTDTMKYIRSQQPSIVLEIGPNLILRDLWNDTNKSIRALSYAIEADRSYVMNRLKKSGDSNVALLNKSLALIASTPNYSLDRFSPSIHSDYDKLIRLKAKLDGSTVTINTDELKLIEGTLRNILQAKAISIENCEKKISQIFEC